MRRLSALTAASLIPTLACGDDGGGGGSGTDGAGTTDGTGGTTGTTGSGTSTGSSSGTSSGTGTSGSTSSSGSSSTTVDPSSSTSSTGTTGSTTDATGTDTDDIPDYEYEGPTGPETTFEHGVASGDPLANSVILWTKLSPGPLAGGDLDVYLEVATDPEMTNRIAAAYYTAREDRNYCFKVEATELSPGTTYYYRFRALGLASPIGRTRTAPADETRVRFAAVSCSNYAYGYFHGYGFLAARADLDLVLHLGDYIYEYGDGEYGSTRTCEPPGEIITLADYRLRYSQYRRDTNLQEAHRQHPWITIWDDHEFTNDPEVGGAENHQPATEGDWETRKLNALQAYDEWMPTRQGLVGDIYRSLAYGPMAQFVVVDVQRPYLFPDPADGQAGNGRLGREQAEWLDQEITLLGQGESGPPRWLVLTQAKTFAPAATSGNGGSAWDVASRERVLDAVRDNGIPNFLVVTGDIHQFRASDIPRNAFSGYDPDTGAGSEGVDLVAGALTSPGGDTNINTRPNMFYSNGISKGYMVVDLTPEELRVDFVGTNLVENGSATPPAMERWWAGFRVADRTAHLVRTMAAKEPKPNPPPLAP
jgi:alkaline phosphatase D